MCTLKSITLNARDLVGSVGEEERVTRGCRDSGKLSLAQSGERNEASLRRSDMFLTLMTMDSVAQIGAGRSLRQFECHMAGAHRH